MSLASQRDSAPAAESTPGDSKAALRLWLRLLACSNLISGELRTRLRSHFDATLPRFDLLAQLDRAPDGLSMGELSRRLMVSNGNVTGVTDRLLTEGWVTRVAAEHDRRSQIVRLTPRGRDAFAEMAAEHEAWVSECFSGLSTEEMNDLTRLLGRLRESVAQTVESSVEERDGG